MSCRKSPETTLVVKGETFQATLISTRERFKEFLGSNVLAPNTAAVVAYPIPRYHHYESARSSYDVVFTDGSGTVLEIAPLPGGAPDGITSSQEATHAVFFLEGRTSRLQLRPGERIEFSAALRENLPPLLVPLRIGGHALRVETAVNSEQRAHGFMYWRRLSRDDGRIFVYPSEQDQGFWMMNCYIDLDIAFFRADGTLLNVVETRKYEDPKVDPGRHSRSAGPAQYVVETNYGWFRAQGLIRDDGAPNGAVRMEILSNLRD